MFSFEKLDKIHQALKKYRGQSGELTEFDGRDRGNYFGYDDTNARCFFNDKLPVNHVAMLHRNHPAILLAS